MFAIQDSALIQSTNGAVYRVAGLSPTELYDLVCAEPKPDAVYVEIYTDRDMSFLPLSGIALIFGITGDDDEDPSNTGEV